MSLLVPHVIVVALENHSYSSITGSGNSFPHLNALKNTYGNCTAFYGVTHQSLPNYMAFASGSDQCVEDAQDPVKNPLGGNTLADSLDAAGIGWRHYAENLPSAGYLGGDASGYVQHHNPWVYFKSFRNASTSYQQSHLVNYSNFSGDLSAGTVPPFVFIQPNNQNNGHSGTATACDNWVNTHVNLVLSSTWYTQNSGIIILWFDEGHPDTDTKGIGDKGCSSQYPGGGQTMCVVISANNRSAVLSSNLNHYGVLRGIEKLYSLPFLINSNHTVNGDLSPLLAVSGGGGTVSVSPSALTFNASQGGSNPASQTVTLTNATNASVSYTAANGGASWLTVSPASGTIAGASGTATSTISVTTGSLAAGTYTGTITYSGSWGSRTVSVSFVVAAAGTVSVSPTALTFNATEGSSNPPTQPVTLTNTTSGAMSYTAASNAPSWLTVAPASGSIAGSGGSATSTIGAQVGTLTAGTYTGIVTYSGSFGSLTVSVSFVVAPQGNRATSNLGNGFTFTVPADTNPRTLKVYVDASAGIGTLVASLSDGSYPDFIDTSLNNTSGVSAGVYTLTYYAASSGQHLTVTYTLSSGVTAGTTKASDTFNRANQTGLGTASDGETYQLLSEAGSPAWSISGNQGKLTSANAGDTGVALLGTQKLQDGEAIGIVNSSNLAGSQGLVLRATANAAAYYRASLTGSSIVLAYVTNGVSTILSSQPATLKASTNYGIRFRIVKNCLYAKYWDASGSEPAHWHVFALDSTLTNAGQYGLRGVVGAANDSIFFDSYSIIDLSATGDPSYVSLYAADLPTGVPTATGSLAVSTSAPTGTIDLTAEGTGDWAHWGLSSASAFDHKAGVTQQISNFTPLGSGTDTQETAALLAYTWSDGTPNASATASPTGTAVQGVANGFQFTVPADTTSRTLNVYVQATKAQGTLTATLSDGSASASSDTSLNDTGTGSVKKYTIVYNAGSANQTLTVQWTLLVDHGGAGTTTTYTSDDYGRANRTDWGSTANGDAWQETTVVGNPIWKIVSNQGQVTATGTAASTANMFLGTQTQANAEEKVDWNVSSVANDAVALDLRATVSNTFYRVEMSGGTTMTLYRRVGGKDGTALASAPFAYSANTWYTTKFQVNGSNLYAKSWPQGGAEPANWQITTTDTASNAITGAGQFGLRCQLHSGDTVLFDNFSVYSIPSGGTPGSIELHAATMPGTAAPPPPPPPPPPPSTLPISVLATEALTSPFLGVGIEQDPYTQGLGSALAVTSDERATINSRINFMNPPIIRTAADSVSWWCPSGVAGTYDFNNALMQEWYQVFENAQTQGYSVIVAVNSPTPFGVTASGWCTAFADLISYLIGTLDYTCIDFVSGLSEPGNNGATYTQYKTTIEPNLVSALTANGLLSQVALIGPDTSTANDSWVTSASADLKSTLSGYVRHTFPTLATAISSDLQETSALALENTIVNNDTYTKPIIQGEMAFGFLGPGAQVGSYQYGVEMADFAVQVLRAGLAAAIAYLLDDDMHGTAWGMWQITASPNTPRPWFFVWSLLCNALPASSTIYIPAQPTANDFRVLASQSPQGAWTFVLVNRASTARNVQLSVPFLPVATTTLQQYVYSQATPLLVDANGFPLPSGTIEAILARGFTVRMDGNSVLVFTQQSAIQTTTFNVKRPPLQRRR